MSEWVSMLKEFSAALPRSCSVSPHSAARARAQWVSQSARECECEVVHLLGTHTHTRAESKRSTRRHRHWLAQQRYNDMHSTSARSHPLKSSLALRPNSQSNLNNDTERLWRLLSASKTFRFKRQQQQWKQQQQFVNSAACRRRRRRSRCQRTGAATKVWEGVKSKVASVRKLCK